MRKLRRLALAPVVVAFLSSAASDAGDIDAHSTGHPPIVQCELIFPSDLVEEGVEPYVMVCQISDDEHPVPLDGDRQAICAPNVVLQDRSYTALRSLIDGPIENAHLANQAGLEIGSQAPLP